MKFLAASFLIAFTLAGVPVNAQKLTSAWTPLLTRGLENFNVFIGVPHRSLASLNNVPKGDGMNGTPLGLNNDPLYVFSIEMINGQPVLHISGEIYGGLSTKNEYENYHLKVEFKWGEKRYEPKLTGIRDGGIVYHALEPYGQFWNAWMRGHNFQVEEGNMGHYYAFSGTGMDIHAKKIDTTKKSKWVYDPSSPLQSFTSYHSATNSCANLGNYENPSGEWNTLEIYCFGTKSVHVVNRHVVMILENSRTSPKDGAETLLAKGKIEFQSEGSEVFYRNIEIQGINKLPDLK